ncbi:uncharacterized protein LOC110810164 [Carica papaya]|uniref:uncharacterized protein LOC110810164 n=1 Tax=Carica papaya TaxID=3649 RepID=UPI000B8CE3C3|nr:uncharacterized protein LOC110810164 [Carica papaya]
MAPSLTSLSTPFSSPIPSLKPNPKQITTNYNHVRCGPRGNRGPLVRGRILSTEAIQAIQALKRAHRSTAANLPSLSRLLKSDLLAALRELLRQDQCTLALHVLSTVRSEYPPVDLNLYADVVNALARNGKVDDIDRLINGSLSISDTDDDGKGLIRLIKSLIGAGRRESMVRVVGFMRESEWRGDDEYVVMVLSRGLRSVGESRLAGEVEKEFGGVVRGNLDYS